MLSALPTDIRKAKAKVESDDESVRKVVKYVFECYLGSRDSGMHFRQGVKKHESSDEVMCVCSAQASQTACSTHMAVLGSLTMKRSRQRSMQLLLQSGELCSCVELQPSLHFWQARQAKCALPLLELLSTSNWSLSHLQS
jgi:hypothetical protein